MTDETISESGQSADPHLRELIQALQESVRQHQQFYEQVGQLVGTTPGNNGSPPSLKNLQDQITLEEKRHSRAKWYTGVLAIFALIIGAVLFYLVFMMARDMNRMEDYMYNMGHAPGDARSRPFELKDPGPSYMLSMAQDMKKMRTAMATMQEDMTAMRGSMSEMDQHMDGMSTDMRAMREDIGAMNASMGRMQYDVLLMRHGVGAMSSDTGAMGVPFRAMNSVVPW